MQFPRPTIVTPLLAGMLIGVAAVLLLQGLARGTTASEADTIAAATEEDALAAYVQAGGGVFAGACEATQSPRDIGKVCARLIDERGATHAYLIGRAFSEFDTWLFLSSHDGGWVVRASVPLDFHATSMAIPWPP